MPGASDLRTLRRRIRSVKSTQKITRSFELIAASRIQRARNAVEAARPYSSLVVRVIRDLATDPDARQLPLLTPRDEVTCVGVLVIASDRGLAGAYNTNLVRRAERLMREERDAGREVSLLAVGRKAEGYFRFRGLAPERVWEGISGQPTYEDARDIAEHVLDGYRQRRYDLLWMVFTDFRSALTQVPATARLWPPDPRQLEGGEEFPPDFMFEPDPATILEQLLPRLIEQRVYAGLLESAASEHASRQRAMKAATDNAGEVIDDLTREANRARQAAITTEITEIVGGAEALSQER